LLVVSAYNYRPQGSTGYISGICGPGQQYSCPNEKQKYIHDFGSILNFIEYAFGTGGNPLGFPGGISGLNYPYADYLALDTSPSCPKSLCPSYSLSDFFDFTKAARTFQTINGAKYPPSCFNNPTATGCFGKSYPQDPDNDANESD
jgi:hypothetical protein